MFGWFSKRRASTANEVGIPTVKFDASRVSDAVKVDLWASVLSLDDAANANQSEIYEAALASITAGRALNILYNALIGLGITNGRAAEISRHLNNRATSIMNVERALSSGITEAKWRYSGAPCFSVNQPTDADLRRDAAHQAANDKRYYLARGMMLDGVATHPGRDAGCKCVSLPIVPGLDS